MDGAHRDFLFTGAMLSCATYKGEGQDPTQTIDIAGFQRVNNAKSDGAVIATLGGSFKNAGLSLPRMKAMGIAEQPVEANNCRPGVLAQRTVQPMASQADAWPKISFMQRLSGQTYKELSQKIAALSERVALAEKAQSLAEAQLAQARKQVHDTISASVTASLGAAVNVSMAAQAAQAIAQAAACSTMTAAQVAAAAAIKERDECRSLLVELDAQLALQSEEISSEMADLASDKANLLLSHQALEARVQALTGQLEAVCEEREESNLKSTELASELEVARSSAKYWEQQATEVTTQLTSQREASAKKLALTEQQLSAANKALQAELVSVIRDRDNAVADAASLRDQMAIKSTQLAEACKVLEDTLATERAASAQRQAECLAALTRVSQDAESSRKAQEEEVASLKLQVSKLTHDLHYQIEELITTREVLADAKKKAQQAQAASVQARKRLATCREELAAVKAELETQLADSAAKLHITQQAAQELIADVRAEAAQQVSDMQTELHGLEQSLEEAEQQLQSSYSKEQYESVEDDCKEAKADRSCMEAIMAKLADLLSNGTAEQLQQYCQEWSQARFNSERAEGVVANAVSVLRQVIGLLNTSWAKQAIIDRSVVRLGEFIKCINEADARLRQYKYDAAFLLRVGSAEALMRAMREILPRQQWPVGDATQLHTYERGAMTITIQEIGAYPMQPMVQAQAEFFDELLAFLI